MGVAFLKAAFEENGSRVAGGEDDWGAGVFFGKLLEEFRAAHSWHHHIGKEQVEFPIVLFGEFQRFDSIAGGEDVEAMLAQDEIGEFAQNFFVFGEENDGWFAAMAEVADGG